MKNDSLLLTQFARLARPALLLLAVVVFYRGHHLPGGGFIGGLLGALGIVLVALGEGPAAARKALGVEPLSLIVVGLSVALAAGIAGLWWGDALLQGLWLPAWGPVHLGTPMLFDLGVMLTVMGFSLKVVFALKEVES